ncbi:hypothetical protein AX774_g6954 [Zancudomyces culisetae]|uniref:Xylanolytic transcriptional activator regulatory domain-containing protein n=1 Tax=Zancudomyces culisetae TaxID=1213189 RepID=A0A1R1PF67_ZANCU|nr:hypothetical protein AX774_g6954 [Zancudomyces culisetae]|eukprot:OMH79624.1 hypothetical protein AX774_g6954 [Zancudomyces culisetae]
MGSTVLKDDKFFKVFTEERRKRVLNYVTEHMEKALSNPDCLSVWTMVVLARYYTTIGILTQCTKYVHLAARLAISMRLHRVDAYSVSTAEREHEQLLVDKELKRRLWWCSYVFCVLLSEAIAAQPALQLKDIFVNLPSNDRLWHTNAKFTLSKTNSANRGDMILSSKGEFRFDTFASYQRTWIKTINVT